MDGGIWIFLGLLFMFGLFVGPHMWLTRQRRLSDPGYFDVDEPVQRVVKQPAPRLYQSVEPIRRAPIAIAAQSIDKETRTTDKQSTQNKAALTELLAQKADDNRLSTLSCLQDIIRKAVHVMIVAPTNDGKTTLATLFSRDRIEDGNRLIVIDPHKKAGDWKDLKVFGDGYNYEEIEIVFQNLLKEMVNRFQKRSQDESYEPEPYTIVIDEWASIQKKCPSAGEFMESVAQEGRKVRMLLIILNQSDRVESLGLNGKGDVRNNFTSVLAGVKAAEIWPKDMQHPPRFAAIKSPAGHKFFDVMMTQDEVNWLQNSSFAGYIDDGGYTEEHDDTVKDFDAPVEQKKPDEYNDHLRLAVFITMNNSLGNTPSIRKMAEHLYGEGNGGGRYSLKVKKILEDIERVTGVTVTGVTPITEPSEHAEQPESENDVTA